MGYELRNTFIVLLAKNQLIIRKSYIFKRLLPLQSVKIVLPQKLKIMFQTEVKILILKYYILYT